MGGAKFRPRTCSAYKGVSVQATRPSLRLDPRSSAQRPLLGLGCCRSSSTTQSLPRVAQPSLWHSMVPSFLRRPASLNKPSQTRRSGEWNPATFYIVIFLLIGSQAIQMIALRNEFLNFSRKADAKIGLLKEVIKRVQRGEDVDVEGLLGTGDSEKEKEWEDVLREIEHEDALWQSGSQKHKNKRSMTQNKGIDTKEHIECEEKPASTIKAVEATSATKGPPRFY